MAPPLNEWSHLTPPHPPPSTPLASQDFESPSAPLYCGSLCPVTNRPPGASHTGTPVLQCDYALAMQFVCGTMRKKNPQNKMKVKKKK